MTNFVTIYNQNNDFRIRNLLNISIFIWFVWILFHFTVVFFFWLVLDSVFLVWLFLWIWNLVALFLDIPVWVLQKYVKAKNMLLIWTIWLFIVSLIFVKFIYFEWISWAVWWSWVIDKTISYFWKFLDSSFNIVLLLISACFYWFIKEVYDVTTLSYIFNNSTPSQYANLISKYNIFSWIWSLVGLIFSSILLSFDIKKAILIFVFIIILFFIFILKYFDNISQTINFKDFKSIKLDITKNDITKKTQQIIKNINTKNLIDLTKQTKVIFLKPIELKKQINFEDIYKTSIDWFMNLKNIVFSKHVNLIIIWIIIIIMQYGFWDTFVSTFQINFLEKVINLNRQTFLLSHTWGLFSWYVLLWLLVIPAFAMQNFFINLSKKIWSFKVIIFWIILSGTSLVCFWIFDKIYLVILFWFLNSIWYAASMPISQALFWQFYNQEYSKKNNLKEIDATTSAAPLKIILNLANVIWLIFWWLFVSLMWFDNFFILFWVILLWFFIFSILNIKKINKLDEVEIIDNDFV